MFFIFRLLFSNWKKYNKKLKKVFYFFLENCRNKKQLAKFMFLKATKNERKCLKYIHILYV